MNRRNLLLTLGAAALTLAPTRRLAAAEHHSGHDPKSSRADVCARACADSLVECARHAHHCTLLVADGRGELARCLELCATCAQACSACVQSCFGPLGATVAESCARVCDACAAECEKFPDDDAMARCARSCRACARACRAFAKAD